MSGKVVRIDAGRIVSDASYHDAFDEALGFPGWYGRNGNAWIDLMSCLDSDRETTELFVEEGETITLLMENAKAFRTDHRDLYDELIECSAFVNWRRLESGRTAYLCLAFAD